MAASSFGNSRGNPPKININLPKISECCALFKNRSQVPSEDDLEWLSHRLEKWKTFGRLLKIEEARLTAFDDKNVEYSEKIYKMLERDWRERNGSAATYTVLHDALCHPLVNDTVLAEQPGAYSNLPQFITGNISLILQFNNFAPSTSSSGPLPL